jgi:hypothetical protein
VVRAASTLTCTAQSVSHRTFLGPSGPATVKTLQGGPMRGRRPRATRVSSPASWSVASSLPTFSLQSRIVARMTLTSNNTCPRTSADILAPQASPPALSPRYWLGWATRVVKTHEAAGTVAGTRLRYDKGDLEIEIEPWLTRDVSGGDERRVFRKWMATDAEAGGVADPGPEAGRVYTVNSTELRAVDIALQPVGVVGGAPLGVVARERRHAAVACDARRRSLPGVAQLVHQVIAALPRELWEISAADENLILSNCW